jgi:ribokinase
MGMGAVVGIGQCAWDFLMDVERLPEPDEKQEARAFTEDGGGPVATALVALARLGVECRFHGVVGADEYGRRIVDGLGVEGVDASGVRVREGGRSQVAFIAVERAHAGRRTIFWERPTGRALMPEELPGGYLERARVLHLDGLMPEVSIHAAREAREAGVAVVVDAGRMREGMDTLCMIADHVVCSARFARDAGLSVEAEDAAKHAAMITRGALTVTLGTGGSRTFMPGGESFHEPAFSVDAVDTTGAGDAFHGGYIYGLLREWPVRRAVRFGAAVAAMSCRAMGGRAGLPDLAGATAFIRRTHPRWED